MLQINIPGVGNLQLFDLIVDFNGTLALDGILIEGVAERLITLSKHLTIHVVTGDSHGTAKKQLENMPCKVVIVPAENQTQAKLEYLKKLDLQGMVAIGNGFNDHQIVEIAKIGIIVIGEEGAATKSIFTADVVVHHIFNALDLLIFSTKLVATLRV